MTREYQPDYERKIFRLEGENVGTDGGCDCSDVGVGIIFKEKFKRTEATIEQWKELYEVATRLKEMKPWEKFWTLDIIGIRTGTCNFGAKHLPFSSFELSNLIITDEELLSDLKCVPRNNAVLEADITILGISVNDKKYRKPVNPATSVIADAATGIMIKYKVQEPDNDSIVSLANELIDFIFNYGVPKEVRVSNILVEAGLKQICSVCGIKLRRVKKLKAIDQFKKEMIEFM